MSGQGIKEIREITSLAQLDEYLKECRATPASEAEDVKLGKKSFYQLKRQDFNYPNGTVQGREYINTRPATIVVPEDSEGNFIMVIQPTGLTKEGSSIEFPAGYAEAAEGGKQTGIRELLEETGMTTDPENFTDLGCHYQNPGMIRQSVQAYLAEYCEQRQGPKPDGGEYIQLYKVSKMMFFEMLQAGYLKDANTYIAGIQALIHLRRLEW